LRKAKADQIPSISSNSKQRNLSPRVSKVVRDFGRGFVEQTLIIDGFKKPVQIRLKTNPVIDRFCKIYNDTTKACAPAPQVRRPFCTQESVIYSPLPAPAAPEGCQPAP
ncbi:MAG: hypothetical protein LKG90_08320, partial [Lachnospiraceae bacterium]|jgi:hypothetical protein|nr:hypothetical protein [Lachnospiraceae bacterium]MCI1422243.1 hypothetical protein [Lachnospiraceae bacterium]